VGFGELCYTGCGHAGDSGTYRGGREDYHLLYDCNLSCSQNYLSGTDIITMTCFTRLAYSKQLWEEPVDSIFISVEV
jgi:hypothetical protein